MNLKGSVAMLWASKRKKKIAKAAQNAERDQAKLLHHLVQKASPTQFAKDHHFADVADYNGFKTSVPIRNYELISPYIDKIRRGEQDILWKGSPIYWSKTSGTTSGTKYIPITKDSLTNHIDTARDVVFSYMVEKKSSHILDGKMMFLSGSPQLDTDGNIPIGRLSGIVHNHIPSYLQHNRLPSYDVNCISSWEEKLDAIIDETQTKDMRLISGIPPWIQMYLDKIEDKTGKSISQLFPHLAVFVHGGVNINPYLDRIQKSLPASVDIIETFPASEGFVAYQDSLEEKGLLLNTNSGIFFEFVPLNDIDKPNCRRYNLEQVELNKNYALILTNNAGLWAYDLGDVVSFVSLSPYRIKVKGRTKHFISAFGEHVIGEEVESSLQQAAQEYGAIVTEFTVAPYIGKIKSNSYHEWFIEFQKMPQAINEMSKRMNELLCSKNSYYDDIIKGGIIAPLKIRVVKEKTFIRYMKAIGKLGEQNKVPHLKNDRTMVNHSIFQEALMSN